MPAGCLVLGVDVGGDRLGGVGQDAAGEGLHPFLRHVDALAQVIGAGLSPDSSNWGSWVKVQVSGVRCRT
ncbi:hypothetical protein Ntsu_40650 [Nocardia sp. IFM 10818]